MQLRDAAETLGVHYQTAYGWVRQGTLRARKTPRGYEVSESDVRDLLARRAAGAEPPREVQVRDWDAQADRLYAALVAGDETQARRDFGRLAAGVPLAGLCDHVIAPALRRVGDGLGRRGTVHRRRAPRDRDLRAAHRRPRPPAAGPPPWHRRDDDSPRRAPCAARHDGSGLPARGSLACPASGRGRSGGRGHQPRRRHRCQPDRPVVRYQRRGPACQPGKPGRSASACRTRESWPGARGTPSIGCVSWQERPRIPAQ